MIGQAKDAEVNSHATDDGVIDRKEKQAIAKSHTKALESRNRSVVIVLCLVIVDR